MIRQITATLAVAAVMIHCVIGCCARCVNACDCTTIIAGEEVACDCCHTHEAEYELCCQPVTSESPTESFRCDAACCEDHACTDPNCEDHNCDGCGKQKCPFIGSESPTERLIDSLLLSSSWHATAIVSLPKALEFRLGGLGALGPPHTGGKLRLHLCLAVLTL